MIFLPSCFAILSLIIQVAALSEAYRHDGYHMCQFDGHTGAKNLSTQQILNQGIEALGGGRSNLNALKRVISHA